MKDEKIDNELTKLKEAYLDSIDKDWLDVADLTNEEEFAWIKIQHDFIAQNAEPGSFYREMLELKAY